MSNEKEVLDKNVENEEYEVEELSEIQQAFDEIGLTEELKRIEKQDSELEVPEFIQKTEVFKNMTAQAYGVACGFKTLLKAGIDYNNAVMIMSNTSVGYDNKETAKAQGIQMQQQMV
jgi:hypothetical protein